MRPSGDTAAVMRQVAWALLPGAALLAWIYGGSVLAQLAVAVLAALVAEAVALRLRSAPVRATLTDGSAAVTGLIVALALPPTFPLAYTALGVVLGLWLGKHAYGGLGHNLFNPAMVGYVLLLLAFPEAIADWPEPERTLLDAPRIDAITHATPLDPGHREAVRPGELLSAQWSVWPWVNGAFALGGLWLVARGVADWRIPTGLLAAAVLSTGAVWLLDPAVHTAPWLHPLLGGTMLVAFFVATDPVTAPAHRPSRWVFGAGIGVLATAIRTLGGHPDGWAFAVLIMNAAAPLMDYLGGRTGGGSK